VINVPLLVCHIRFSVEAKLRVMFASLLFVRCRRLSIAIQVLGRG